MNTIKKYDEFLIQEKYDKNIKTELKRLGVNKKDIKILTAVIVLGYLYKCINT